MKRPFNIFPSVAYRNSQFQVLSSVDNLEIEILHQGRTEKIIPTQKESPITITKLDNAGTYIAKCTFENQYFEQTIEVKDAFRVGDSVFEKAFVFDDTNYSFFLMKDRLFIYDELKNIHFTENNYRPTEILRIDKDNFLFITKIGDSTNSIVNFGVYNIASFSMLGELLDDYQDVLLSPESNKAWLFNKTTSSIHCFELVNHTGIAFTELRKYENASNHYLDNKTIRIIQNDKVIFIDTQDLHKTFKIEKAANLAIDKLGNSISWNGEELTFSNAFSGEKTSIRHTDRPNLDKPNYIDIGVELKAPTQYDKLDESFEQIKSKLVPSFPDKESYYLHPLSEEEQDREVLISNRFFPVLDGVFVFRKEVEEKLVGIHFRKNYKGWTANKSTEKSETCSLLLLRKSTSKIKIRPTKSSSVKAYSKSCLIVEVVNQYRVYNGKEENVFPSSCDFTFYSINENSYLLIEHNEENKQLFSLYETSNLYRPILHKVEIYNKNHIETHRMIWYSGKVKIKNLSRYLNAFDLATKFHIKLHEKRVQHSLFKDASNYTFKNGYILSSNKIIIHPQNVNIKDAYLGNIRSHSKDLSKIVSNRNNLIYLSIFNPQNNKYEQREINLGDTKYDKSHLSPDGQFLVLQGNNNKYSWYDIEKNEHVKFFSGKFIAFTQEGNLIVEADGRRAAKIHDPLTFAEVTPPNYHYYKFQSPDGKLYASTDHPTTRFRSKLTGNVLSKEEKATIEDDFDDKATASMEEKEQIDKNRRVLFDEYQSEVGKLHIKSHSEITSDRIIKKEKYIKIGIVGTDVTLDIELPINTKYYNYAAFSYDNKYLGIVGKPNFGHGKSLIKLCEISFDNDSKKLELIQEYHSDFPSMASWVCGFSKAGYFALYDSNPNTYLAKLDTDFFKTQKKYASLRGDLFKCIRGKNFLCFSPTGKYLALSEQGYEPLTLGGYGHKESGAVHIALTETLKIIDSFTEHGDEIKNIRSKNIPVVMFSEDEKRIMSLSRDGVVIVRNIKMPE